MSYYTKCNAGHVMLLSSRQLVSLEIHCSIQSGQVIYERSYVGSGSGVVFPLPACKENFVRTGGCGEAVTKNALLRAGSLSGVAAPSATNCAISMANYERCQAVCADGLRVAGYIQCLDGRLSGSSVCGSRADTSITVKEVKTVFGAFDMTAKGELDATGMKGALGHALAPPSSTLKESDLVVSWTRTPSGSRRLTGLFMMRTSSASRRLTGGSGGSQPSCGSPQEQAALTSYKYSSRYEVAVSPNGPSSSSISQFASQLSVPTSAAAAEFTSKLESVGICVDGSSIQTVMAPTILMKEMFVDSSGEVLPVVLPIDTNPEISTGPDGNTIGLRDIFESNGKEDSSAAAVVGGIVGGLFGLIIILGCLYYFIVMRKLAEA